MEHKVARVAEPPKIDARWDKAPWTSVESLAIDQYMGKRPEHFPRVKAKLAYDDAAVYVIFRVEDRYVRAVTPENQGQVCKDSCVEFFFTPGTDVSRGYFNLEMNCGGRLLFHFQAVPRQPDRTAIAECDVSCLEIAHSLPRIVEPEIAEPVTWTVEYRLPVSLLGKYSSVATPVPGVVWMANLYKCGDSTSHPHWLSWSPLGEGKLDFHRPDSFGKLEFE